MLPLISAFKKDLYHCADCNYCVDAVWAERGIDHVCATMQHHTPLTSYSGRGYIAAARAWLEGVDLDLNALGERVFTCTTCGNCEQVCPIGLHPTAVGRALRGELWAHEQVPAPLAALHQDLLRDENPNGVPRAQRMQWACGLPKTAETIESVLYLPGCAAATTTSTEARAAVALFTAAGYWVNTLGEADSCCGAPLHELGLDHAAARMFEALSGKASGDRLVVMSGLECACSWQRGAATRQALSFVAWLAQALHAGRLQLHTTRDLGSSIHLLDSCQSRRSATNSLVREILNGVGVAFTSSPTDPRYVVCCGAAGGMPRMQPESAARMACARISASEPDSLWVSADPRCVAHLRAAMPSARVFGLAEFLTTYCAGSF